MRYKEETGHSRFGYQAADDFKKKSARALNFNDESALGTLRLRKVKKKHHFGGKFV